jgi:hypothetical protein
MQITGCAQTHCYIITGQAYKIMSCAYPLPFIKIARQEPGLSCLALFGYQQSFAKGLTPRVNRHLHIGGRLPRMYGNAPCHAQHVFHILLRRLRIFQRIPSANDWHVPNPLQQKKL